MPHISFVRGDDDVAFLRRRCEALCGHPLFEGMEYSQDRGELAEWMPLVMARPRPGGDGGGDAGAGRHRRRTSAR